MKLNELIVASGIVPYGNLSSEIEIDSVVSLASKASEGSLFFAIEGLHRDGHAYIAEAVERGARAVVVKKGRGTEFFFCGVPVLEAEDVRSALAFSMDAICGYPSRKLKIIAVTGTNGKTSISYMLCAILARAGVSFGMIGTSGCFCEGERVAADSSDPLANMTTPDPEELYKVLGYMAQRKTEYVVMEATSHASVLKKLAPLHFVCSVFSNLTPEHLDLHSDMEAYFDAKKDVLRRADKIIVNIDDPYGRRATVECGGARTITVSADDKNADFITDAVRRFSYDGICYTLCGGGKRTVLQLPVIGDFNISNSSLAAVCAYEIGIPLACIKGALSEFCGVCGRMQKVNRGLGVPFHVFVDYAHTPDALENVLSTFRKLKVGDERIVLVFGCGGDRDQTKRSSMGRIASHLADEVVVTSDNSRGETTSHIISQILLGFDDGFDNYTVIPDRKRAIEHVIREAREGDVIVLAGKGHEKYEIDRRGRHPFDEEAIVAECCKRYRRK